MKKFDIMTPIGIVAGIIAIMFAILNNAGPSGVAYFIHISSVLIVIGGLVGAIMINFSLAEVKLVPKVLREAFREAQQDLPTLIDTFVDLSTKARREGLLALEVSLEEVDDPFIRKGVLLAVDGIEPDIIKDIMMAEVVATEERHRKGRLIIEKCGEYAPAWGMIGTLIGLVLMLQNLNDPATLGPNMAIALITTLYGTLLANLVFIPMASKLANKTEEEVFVKQIIVEGVIGVQSGQNPKILEEKLSAFLPETSKQRDIEESEGVAVDGA
ncbi:motility protein A [Anaerobacillus alkalidiazotrophicus]|uniref:Motility protein A n=1 Tax=Anaerobacillus alkalidiazotrophicus TaxID=472963 RepID=A0A1S2M7B0_9BACI|nr:flagellar motor protein MotP [Anaerobacillus alkalidiazotrophicus]OIJ18228.1 motility protein A [Anaerobacillus alkalidiazotrophicus]OIJ19707.1 motility protein A [Anaerobacillus alkalidiazotrophicus]